MVTAPRLVVALGANALLQRGEPIHAETQRRNIRTTAEALARLSRDYSLVVTHGNAPQIGLLSLLEARGYTSAGRYPLDILGAESQALIGYFLVQALGHELPDRMVAMILTQVIVASDDEAFSHPTKRIGPLYSESETRTLAGFRDWSFTPEGPYSRRVVASPCPLEIVERDAIERLLGTGCVVVCAGGGGVPVVRENGRLRGVEAVVDKDRTAALLAEDLGAERLVFASDVENVVRDWHSHSATPIAVSTPDDLRAQSFADDSMGPKVEAAVRFVERTGGTCAIGALGDLVNVVRGEAGTQIVPAWAVLPTP